MTHGNILKLKDFQSLTNSQFPNPNLKFAIELNWQFLKFPNIASALRKIRSSITQILCERLWSLGNKRKPQWCNIVFWYRVGESGQAISNLVSFRWCSTYPLICWDLLVSDSKTIFTLCLVMLFVCNWLSTRFPLFSSTSVPCRQHNPVETW